MYLYSNILGTFVFNQNFQIREKHLFSDEESKAALPLLIDGKVLDSEKKYMVKFKDIINLRGKFDSEALLKAFDSLAVYRENMRDKNIFLTKQSVKESVTGDLLIVQASQSIMELNKEINVTAKRLREWYSYAAPEVVSILHDHKVFAERVVKDRPEKLIKEFSIKETMGKELGKDDLSQIIEMAKLLLFLYEQKEKNEIYLEKLMRKNCPNLTEVAGFLTGAKLLSMAGSLREMVMMPASTIQLLGAEKALFRHMINKNSKSPKHGMIVEHPIVQRVARNEKGKASRALADKISLAVKVDFFKGEFIGDKLRKQLEERFK